jgi:hypothetical protein
MKRVLAGIALVALAVDLVLGLGFVPARQTSTPATPIVRLGHSFDADGVQSPNRLTLTIDSTPAHGFFVAYQTLFNGHIGYFGIQHGIAIASIFADSASAVPAPGEHGATAVELGAKFASVRSWEIPTTGSHRLSMTRVSSTEWSFVVDDTVIGWITVPGHGGTDADGLAWVEYMPNSQGLRPVPAPSYHYGVTINGRPVVLVH